MASEDPKYDTSARKGKRKAAASDMDGDGDGDGDVSASTASKMKKNKQRVLLLSSRGITHRMRHLMNDLEALLPHVKKGVCKPTVCTAPASMLTGVPHFRFEARFEESPPLATGARGSTLV